MYTCLYHFQHFERHLRTVQNWLKTEKSSGLDDRTERCRGSGTSQRFQQDGRECVFSGLLEREEAKSEPVLQD